MNLDITFEQTPWEQALAQLRPGDRIDALRLLTLTEDELWEDVAQALEDNQIGIDLYGLDGIPVSAETAQRLKLERRMAEKDSFLQELSETDPLRVYLEELAGIPVAGDLQVMALELLEGRQDRIPLLINGMLGTVWNSAKTLAGRGVLLLDLIQEGSLGLMQAISRYSGGPVEEFCRWWVDLYLSRALVLCAREAGIGQKMRQGMEDYLDMDQQLLAELGRNPTLEEIAFRLHMTPEEAYAYANMVEAARMRSRVEEARKEKEPEPEDSLAVEDTAYFQSRQRIDELLSGLTPREAELLSLRFGLDGKAPLSPEDTGKKLGMTPGEVLDMEAAALKKLRPEG